METPSSIRRITRSQSSALKNNSNNNNCSVPISRKTEESEVVSKSRNGKRQQDRSALIDISNDSPIVGVAMGKLLTPSSYVGKQTMDRSKMTPGSGEALLRGQVKFLLQKVEEEAEISKLSFDGSKFLHQQGFVLSPSGLLLAPTPANTPQVTSTLDDSMLSFPVIEEESKISQVLNEIFNGKQESIESEKSLVTRSLLLDFSEKSECSSGLTYIEMSEESVETDKPLTDDDDSSVWSVQVNTSNKDEKEDEYEYFGSNYEDLEQEEEYFGEEYEQLEEEKDGGCVDELCFEMNKMIVNEKSPAKIIGKHKRFVYDSDDEIVGDEDCGPISSNIIRLKGLPTPKGKHLRFPDE